MHTGANIAWHPHLLACSLDNLRTTGAWILANFSHDNMKTDRTTLMRSRPRMKRAYASLVKMDKRASLSAVKRMRI